MDPAALQQPELFEVWGRDPERTPMQWDDTTNAGFARQGARPWLPLAGNYRARNVAAQSNAPDSMLTLFRQLAALRRAEPALNRGAYEAVDLGVEDVLAYRRTENGHNGFLVILNFGSMARALDLRAAAGTDVIDIVTGTDLARVGSVSSKGFLLAGHEGIIVRLPSAA
jgi:alpha-glucosidase